MGCTISERLVVVGVTLSMNTGDFYGDFRLAGVPITRLFSSREVPIGTVLRSIILWLSFIMGSSILAFGHCDNSLCYEYTTAYVENLMVVTNIT